MDNALTDQDDMSADVPLAAASVSDPEICRRFEAVCEEKFQCRTNWILLLILGALVLGVCWMFGVPQMIQGWYAEWTMSSEQRVRQDHREFMASSMNLGAPPPRPTTLFSPIEQNLAPILALLFGLFVVLWMIANEAKLVWLRRSQRRLRDGVRRFGLHACPRCGCDTRSDVKNCSLCREIITDHVPPFWRQYILADPNFEKHGHPFLKSRVPLNQRFPPGPLGRASVLRRILIFMCVSFVIGAGLWLLVQYITPPPLINSILTGTFKAVFIVFLFTGLFKLFCKMRTSCSGFCPYCQHEQMIEDSSGRCSECGRTYLQGQLLYEIFITSKAVRTCVVLGMFLLYCFSPALI
jgi:hypothetical protein